MSQAPLATIAIPTFNRAHTVARAVQSARDQSYPNVEIIVCDNASNDETADVVASMRDTIPDLRVMRHETNVGAVPNFVLGLEEAKGDYFMWLADDDWIDEDYLACCIGQLQLYPAAVLASGAAHYYTTDGGRTTQRPADLLQPTSSRRILAFYRTVMSNGSFYGVTRTDVRRSIPLVGELGGDWIHIAALAAQGKLVTAPTSIHRAASGSGAGLHLGRRRYSIAIARTVLRETTESNGFGALSGPQRRAVALAASATVVWRFWLLWLVKRAVGALVSTLRAATGPTLYARIRRAYRQTRRCAGQ